MFRRSNFYPFVSVYRYLSTTAIKNLKNYWYQSTKKKKKTKQKKEKESGKFYFNEVEHFEFANRVKFACQQRGRYR